MTKFEVGDLVRPNNTFDHRRFLITEYASDEHEYKVICLRLSDGTNPPVKEAGLQFWVSQLTLNRFVKV